MSTGNPAEQPVTIDLERTRELRITWADGRQSVYPLALLRRQCPCAACRQAREERKSNPLAVVEPADEQRGMVIAEKAEMVGNYALRITWQDGHDAGIYDYGLLRSLSAASGAVRTEDERAER